MKNRIDVCYQKALAYFRAGVDGKGIDNKMLGAAVAALEKQVPKRVADERLGTVCPACRGSLYLEDLNVVEKSRYCPDCGQKPVGAVFLYPFGGDSMDLTEIMQEAQQSLGGDYEQLAISN